MPVPFRLTGITMKKIIYYASIFLSVALLVVGYCFISSKGTPFETADSTEYVNAKILEITDTTTTSTAEGSTMTDTVYTFNAKLLGGKNKGETVSATQLESSYANFNARPVSVGDKVILCRTDESESWSFAEYHRSDIILILAAAFCAALVIFGHSKGLKTLVTLLLTVASVVFVLIPAILSGQNIYIWTVMICIYITAMTLVIVNGVSYMSLVGGIGCIGGVAVAAIITTGSDIFLKLSGYTDDCTLYLSYIGGKGTIDIRALTFAGILIGSIGAVMDVAVNIAASLHEVANKIDHPSFKELYKSGITISRDIIGTMSNTLILAFIGSSLCSLLLIVYYNAFSPLNLFNKEIIVTQLLEIIAGSFGILSALPLTSLISALFYSRFDKTTMGLKALQEEPKKTDSNNEKKQKKKKHTYQAEIDEYSKMLDEANKE